MAADRTIKLELTPAQVEIAQEAMEHCAGHLAKSRIAAVLAREVQNLRIYLECARKA